ncbi:MAG: LPS export ABC transporter permease LptF [Proteobacteria bacterium]|nr:LPS export ABC transporter permease LptF [Pseudomonadota bacterium]MBU1738078.1 LPS export ABC transporter permease LptF [Pseudomonadota bacterium]
MPILLYAYLASEMLGPFFASLVIINAVLFLGKLSSFLEMIFSFGVDFPDFLRISSYLLPNLMLFSIPMASTIGVIIAFSRLAGDNEILAFKASGIGLYKMLPPVILIALFTSLLTGAASWSLIPKGSVAMKKTMYQLAREKVDKGLRPREFSDSVKDIVIYIDEVDNSGEWQGVYISDRRDKDNPLTILAKNGNLNSRLDEMMIILSLKDGSIHRAEENSSQTIEFKSYRLHLPINFNNPTYKDGTPIKSQDTSDLTPAELSAKSKEHQIAYLAATDDQARIRHHDRMTSILLEFHKRLALPVGCFILTLLALPLALQSRPGQRQMGLPLGLFFFILYYIMLTFAKSTAEVSPLPVWVVMWSPNLLLGIITFLFIRTSARENSVSHLERMMGILPALLAPFRKKTGETGE